ncbi:MAG: TonB-dependent receptor plug domain-containing protein [Chlorobi bacterium]|nr:TonB-dependent receptor plug domain-containing protein [Chlorobiota bacterium]
MNTRTYQIYKLILFLSGLLTSHSVLSQEVLNVHVIFKESPSGTRNILEYIEQQTGVVVSYSNKLCFNEEIKSPFREATIRKILDYLFKDCPAVYIVRENKVIIKAANYHPKKYTISGYVTDTLNKEVMIGANIYDENSLLGTTSNNFGFYSLTLPEGYISFKCSYIGYQKYVSGFKLNKDTVINISLIPQPELEEVSVMGVRIPAEIESTSSGTISVPIEQIRNLPVFLGEVDLLKSIQMLPGVQSGGEGFSGLNVRGGGPDQNLVLLDDVPVYNVGHLLGVFSIFNADAINKVSIIKGGFPARFGGRLSSVVDIRTFDGDSKNINGSASIGILSSRVSINGPLIEDKLMCSLSFRRTYYDLISAPFRINSDERNRYYFFDLNGKLTFLMSDKDKFYLSSYWGEDEYDARYNFNEIEVYGKSSSKSEYETINDQRESGWGNLILSARWNHVFGKKLFSNITAVFSDYRFHISQTQNYMLGDKWNYIYQRYFSGIRDFGLKIDFDYIPFAKHYIRFGGSVTSHSFYPGIDVVMSDINKISPVDTTYGGNYLVRPEVHMYIEDDFKVFSRLKVNIGAHFSAFMAETKKYTSIEPRMLGRFLITNELSLKGSFSTMSQYIHLLKTANVALPTDMWLPVSDNIKPMRSRQSSFGVEWSPAKDIMISVEGYHKKLSDILDLKAESSFFDYSLNWEELLVSGDGESNGLEFFLHKKTGVLSGWFGYTLSKTTNRFDELNNGNPFPSNTDRRHDVSMFLSYKFNKKVDGGITWLFGSGTPITLPSDKYYAPDIPTGQYDEAVGYNMLISTRNGYRMPNFHRMDIGFNFKKKKNWGMRIWSAGIINVYGRQNPFFLYFDDNLNEETGEFYWSLKQFSLFPFPIPYVRYTIKF